MTRASRFVLSTFAASLLSGSSLNVRSGCRLLLRHCWKNCNLVLPVLEPVTSRSVHPGIQARAVAITRTRWDHHPALCAEIVLVDMSPGLAHDQRPTPGNISEMPNIAHINKLRWSSE